MTNKWTIEAIRIVSPILVIFLGVLVFRAIGEPPQAQPREDEAEVAQDVQTVLVREATDGLLLDVDGLVVPYREVTLAAEVAGRVTYKNENLRTGAFIDAETKLFEIDKEVYEIAMQRAAAELQQAWIDYASVAHADQAAKLRKDELEITELPYFADVPDAPKSAGAGYVPSWKDVKNVDRTNLEFLIAEATRKRDIAKGEFDRVERLYRGGNATKTTLEGAEQRSLDAQNALTTLQNQERQLAAREQRLKQAVLIARALYANAVRDYRRSTVTTPCCGVVVQDQVESDGYVQRGTPLIVVEDTSRVEVLCNLTLDEMAWLWQDERAKRLSEMEDDHPDRDNVAYELPPVPVTIEFEVAGHTYDWAGVFKRYDGIGVDERTRTLPCRIEVSTPREYIVDHDHVEKRRPDGPPALVRGMYVDVQALIKPRSEMLVLPERAVRPGNEVWVVTDRLDDEGKPVTDPETGKPQRELAIVSVNVAWRSGENVYITKASTKLEADKSEIVVSPLPDPEPGVLLAPALEETPEPATATPLQTKPSEPTQPTSPAVQPPAQPAEAAPPRSPFEKPVTGPKDEAKGKDEFDPGEFDEPAAKDSSKGKTGESKIAPSDFDFESSRVLPQRGLADQAA